MNYFSENIKFLRIKIGLTQHKVADTMDFKRSQWNNYEKGISYPKFLDLIKIANFFDIPESHLIHTDLREMHPEKPKNINEPPNVYELKTDNNLKNQLIPLYDITATASVVEIFNDSSKIVPMDHIKIPNLPKCDGAIHITGDSMYPLLKSGDIALYREVQDKSNIIWGEMYLIYLNNNGDEFFFCKYIHKSEREGYVRLASQNQHHQPVEFPIESIKQLAIVKASIRINSVV